MPKKKNITSTTTISKPTQNTMKKWKIVALYVHAACVDVYLFIFCVLVSFIRMMLTRWCANAIGFFFVLYMLCQHNIIAHKLIHVQTSGRAGGNGNGSRWRAGPPPAIGTRVAGGHSPGNKKKIVQKIQPWRREELRAQALQMSQTKEATCFFSQLYTYFIMYISNIRVYYMYIL